MDIAIGKEPVGRISDGFLEGPERDTQFADRLRSTAFIMDVATSRASTIEIPPGGMTGNFRSRIWIMA
jgi:hypothetical protein